MNLQISLIFVYIFWFCFNCGSTANSQVGDQIIGVNSHGMLGIIKPAMISPLNGIDRVSVELGAWIVPV